MEAICGEEEEEEEEDGQDYAACHIFLQEVA